jgi:hypothetical protein
MNKINSVKNAKETAFNVLLKIYVRNVKEFTFCIRNSANRYVLNSILVIQKINNVNVVIINAKHVLVLKKMNVYRKIIIIFIYIYI